MGYSLYDTVVVFDKVRENTKNITTSTRRTYAESANLAVNQTLVRSINTSIAALLPVGAILYVGVVMLGSGPLKDLALALFVGMAAGAYSSIFIATPLLVQLKMRDPAMIAQAKRVAGTAQRRGEGARHATRPSTSPSLREVDEDGDDAVPATTAPRKPRPQPAAATDEQPQRPSVRSRSGRRVRSAARTPDAAARDPRGDAATRWCATSPTSRSRASSSRTSRRCWPTPTASAQVVDALAGFGRDASGAVVVDKVAGRRGARLHPRRTGRARARRRLRAGPQGRASCPDRRTAPTYALEYGEATLEVQHDAFDAGDRVLVIDDVLATGGTLQATASLIGSCKRRSARSQS